KHLLNLSVIANLTRPGRRSLEQANRAEKRHQTDYVKSKARSWASLGLEYQKCQYAACQNMLSTGSPLAK
ncbi:MAG: hypothetical protein KGQ42_06530, partial [Alphaproteobacteria bacterium]|nr:hypothetical protein [Alphaproteobacteria bacterium]